MTLLPQLIAGAREDDRGDADQDPTAPQRDPALPLRRREEFVAEEGGQTPVLLAFRRIGHAAIIAD